MQLLITTTNPAKIERYTRYFKTLAPAMSICSLRDLDPNQIVAEPAENGENEVQNSTLKAKYYQKIFNFDGLVFAEDSGMALHGVEDSDNPRKDIKKPVVAKYGEVTPENLVNYYSELATKYGGKIEQEWVFGYSMVSLDSTATKTLKNPSILVAEIQYPINQGYTLNSVTRVVKDDEEVYLSLLEPKEWQEHWDKEVVELLDELLTPFLK